MRDDDRSNDSDTSAPRATRGARLQVARRRPSPTGGPFAPPHHKPQGAAQRDPNEKRAHRREIAAYVSSAIARLLREHTGVAPTQVRTVVSGELVVVTLRDYLTSAERTVAREGNRSLAMLTRAALHEAIRADTTSAVEDITGRFVSAYFSDQQVSPEVAIIVFLFEFPHGLEVAD